MSFGMKCMDEVMAMCTMKKKLMQTSATAIEEKKSSFASSSTSCEKTRTKNSSSCDDESKHALKRLQIKFISCVRLIVAR